MSSKTTAQYFFTTAEGEAALTVNILRLWNREKIERFALHLLGDSYHRMQTATPELFRFVLNELEIAACACNHGKVSDVRCRYCEAEALIQRIYDAIRGAVNNANHESSNLHAEKLHWLYVEIDRLQTALRSEQHRHYMDVVDFAGRSEGRAGNLNGNTAGDAVRR